MNVKKLLKLPRYFLFSFREQQKKLVSISFLSINLFTSIMDLPVPVSFHMLASFSTRYAHMYYTHWIISQKIC